MTLLFPIALDVAVLKAIKAQARKALPSVGSSHLSEAIAATCGYRTSIALKSALAQKAAFIVYPSPAFGAVRLAAIGGLPAGLTPEAVEHALSSVLASHASAPYGPQTIVDPVFFDRFLRSMAAIRDAGNVNVGFDDPLLNGLSAFITLSSAVEDDEADLGVAVFARIIDGLPLDGVGWVPTPSTDGGGWSKSFALEDEVVTLVVKHGENQAVATKNGALECKGSRSAHFARLFAQIIWRIEFPKRQPNFAIGAI